MESQQNISEVLSGCQFANSSVGYPVNTFFLSYLKSSGSFGSDDLFFVIPIRFKFGKHSYLSLEPHPDTLQKLSYIYVDKTTIIVQYFYNI